MIYYIADIHFQDQRIFELCSRPFKNLEDYEEQIITKWNNKVEESDTVYLVGDISGENNNRILDTLKKLNGHKHLILGNHDTEVIDLYRNSGVFETIKDMDFIRDNNRDVHVCHYPMMDWKHFNYGSYHVYGHIHNKNGTQNVPSQNAYKQIIEYYKDKKAYNCGVDVTNFEPVTLDEMIVLKGGN